MKKIHHEGAKARRTTKIEGKSFFSLHAPSFLFMPSCLRG